MGAKKEKLNERGRIRFLPDPGTYALVETRSKNSTKKNSSSETILKDFHPDITGLIFNESYSGCALVVMNYKSLKVGYPVRIKLDYLTQPMNGEIRWIKELPNGIARVGIKYLE